MSSGWRWRIPTQERFGNGYVFCDAFINETEAFDEVQSEFEETISIGKKIKFSAGYVDKCWIKNCVTVGLASMFVEPLEASSIGSTIQLVRMLGPFLGLWSRENQTTVKKYNESANLIVTNIIDFIQLHYFTTREDTEFWKWCKHNIKMTDFNKEYIDVFKNNFVNDTYFSSSPLLMFRGLNFAQVMHGLQMFNTEKIKALYQENFNHLTQKSIQDLAFDEGYYKNIDDTVTHREALNVMINAPKEWK